MMTPPGIMWITIYQGTTMQLIDQHCIVAGAEDLESDYQGLEPHSTFYQLWFWGMLCNWSELLFTHLMKVTNCLWMTDSRDSKPSFYWFFTKSFLFSTLASPRSPLPAVFSQATLCFFLWLNFPAHSLHVFVIWSYKGLISQYPWGIPLSLMFLLLTRKCLLHLHLQALPHVTPDSHVWLPTGHHHKHSWHKAEYMLSPTLLPGVAGASEQLGTKAERCWAMCHIW